jgi:iron(III) transport system permease protein
MVLYPVSWLVLGSFWSGRPGSAGHLTLEHYQRMLSSIVTWELLWTSLVISLLKSLLACAGGLFLAWLVARTNVPFRRVIAVMAPLPFFVPPLITTMGWATLGNPTNGVLNLALRFVISGDQGPINIYSMGGIIFVMALTSSSFVYLMMLGAMSNMDTSLEESARMSGATQLQTFRTITFPLLRPALAGAALLTFMSGLEAFETPTILGTPGRVEVFTSAIYREVRWEQPPNHGGAMTLAMLLTAVMFLAVLIQWRWLGRRSYTTITGRGYRAQIVDLGRGRWPAFGAFLVFFGLAVALPIGLVVATSFFRIFGIYSLESITLDNYAAILGDRRFGTAFINSLALSVVGALATLLLCSLIAYVIVRTKFRFRRVLEVIAWLPWALPGIVLSLAMLWAYIRLPIPIYGTIWILFVAYITNGLPLGVRVMSGVFAQVGKELEESARMAGAPWHRAFIDVVMALVRPAFVAGWLVIGAMFLRSLSIAVMLGGFDSDILPLLSLRAWELGRGGEAAAVATIMLGLLVLFVLLEMTFRAWSAHRAARRRRLSATAPSSMLAPQGSLATGGAAEPH